MKSVSSAIKRDRKGRWKKGTASPNPLAYTRPQPQSELPPSADFASLVTTLSESRMARIAQRLVKDAAAGNPSAVESVLRLRGQVSRTEPDRADLKKLTSAQLGLLHYLVAVAQGAEEASEERWLERLQAAADEVCQQRFGPPKKQKLPPRAAKPEPEPEPTPTASPELIGIETEAASPALEEELIETEAARQRLQPPPETPEEPLSAGLFRRSDFWERDHFDSPFNQELARPGKPN